MMVKAKVFETVIGFQNEIGLDLEHQFDVETFSQDRRLKRIITLYENKAKYLDYTIHYNPYVTPKMRSKAKSELRKVLESFYGKYGMELYF